MRYRKFVRQTDLYAEDFPNLEVRNTKATTNRSECQSDQNFRDICETMKFHFLTERVSIPTSKSNMFVNRAELFVRI